MVRCLAQCVFVHSIFGISVFECDNPRSVGVVAYMLLSGGVSPFYSGAYLFIQTTTIRTPPPFPKSDSAGRSIWRGFVADWRTFRNKFRPSAAPIEIRGLIYEGTECASSAFCIALFSVVGPN